ncbi:MAG: dihydrofolate reductase [Rhizomicrobium sp.]
MSAAPIISLIWAQGAGGVIGKDGTLPWRLAEDMQHFKALTLGKPCLMGRKTWDSLPEKFRPLPGRPNLVLTRDVGFAASGATVVHSLSEGWNKGAELGHEVMVIGGATLYQAALADAGRIYLTDIHARFDGDAYAPAIDPAHWAETAREDYVGAGGLSFSFVTLNRQI